MEKHNHITRDIKPLGECPSCDKYHNRNKEKPREWNIQLLHGKPTCSSVYMNAENVHVIEYSALEAERAKVARLKEIILNHYECAHKYDLIEALAELEQGE